ncbi:uncharacterized protein LOC126065183 isoform X3 [Elephas maximus indicus]|uniref:uncharacterized protein LOC126065183 isoform X3 n=1 Tax=Elephas maximus indicus TaxID=99487 RepID=UPI002116568B|nr:uncharacterized protein LOC126065183 isoform X3 [Elephas maximus indicus]
MPRPAPRAPRPWGPEWRSGAVGKREKHRKRWERVRSVSGAVSLPGTFQGAWPRVTSAERPRGWRRKARAGPPVRERLQSPSPVALGGLGLTLKSDRTTRGCSPPDAGLGRTDTGASPPCPCAPPRGPGQPPAPLCLFTPLQGVKTVGCGRVLYPVPSVQLPAPGSPMSPRYGLEGVGDHEEGGCSEARLSQAWTCPVKRSRSSNAICEILRGPLLSPWGRHSGCCRVSSDS